MKKLGLICFVALLGIALVVPAYALENQFGGYWRTRMYSQTDFDGVDNDVNREDLQQVDSRTRIYYTAVLNDNLKFVNKFEFNYVWGDTGLGDIGADGDNLVIKNSYVDFNYMDFNVKVGAQPAVIQRAFLFDDDFSGITVSSGGFTGVYMKVAELGDGPADDAQYYHAKYAIGAGDITITPSFVYADMPTFDIFGETLEIDQLWWLGVDIDGAAGGLGYWATLIYNGGSGSLDDEDFDVAAWLVALGGNVALTDAADLHFRGFYATGQDLEDDDEEDVTAFLGTGGEAYYWAEIMGWGILDNRASNGSPAGTISNVMAAGAGVSFKVSDDLKLGADLWYAQLVEDDENGNTDLGTEVDLSATYTIVEGMNLDLVAAYLFAGDATTNDSDDDADPIELVARWSISF
jgi:hypothetical protein